MLSGICTHFRKKIKIHYRIWWIGGNYFNIESMYEFVDRDGPLNDNEPIHESLLHMHKANKTKTVTEVDPEEKQIVIFNKTTTNLSSSWSLVPRPCQCHTVLEGIARDPLLTTWYKGQWSLCPIRVSMLKLHVCSHSRTYIQQCTFKRQCTTKALVASTQLLYVNCFSI